jgi:hypothetical protein
MSTFDHAGITVKPGERGFTWLPVTMTARGTELRLPLHVVNGAQEGPTLGLCCVVHGDAVYPIEVVRNVLSTLDPQKVRGTVTAIPVANPVAFESGTRVTGVGMNTDKTNLNRVFPGTAEGWLTEQIANVVTRQFLGPLDYLIDFHCGGLDNGINYTRIDKTDTPYGEEHYKLSLAYGTDVVCLMKSGSRFLGTITELAEEMGIVAVLSEIGGNFMYENEAYLQHTTQGVMNVMKQVEMLDGEPILPARQMLVHDRCLMRPTVGGLFYPHVGYEKLAKTVPEGTLIGEVISPYTFESLYRMEAPYKETVLIMMRGNFSRINPGDYAYILGDASTAETILNH